MVGYFNINENTVLHFNLDFYFGFVKNKLGMSWAKLSLGWDCGLVKIGFKTMEINFEIN